MAGLVTFANLKLRARRRADHENSAFVSDAEVGDYVNAALDELVDLIEDQVSVGYLSTAYVFNTVAGTSNYLVGNGTTSPYMYRLIAVQMQYQGAKQPLEQGTLLDLLQPDYGRGWTSPGTVRYAMSSVDPTSKQRTVAFWPVPQAVHQVTVTYVPLRTDLVTPTDDAVTVQCLGWDEWVVVRAAMKILRKEESDTAGLQAELNELTARVQAAAARENAGRPQQIGDSSALPQRDLRDLPGWAQ